MLESHLNELRREVDSGGLSLMKSPGTDQMKRLERLEHDCYVCGRIEFSLTRCSRRRYYYGSATPNSERS